MAYHEAGHALLARLMSARHPQGHDRSARTRARLHDEPARGGPLRALQGRAGGLAEGDAGRPRRRADRVRPHHQRRRQRLGAGHRGCPLDGVRVGIGPPPPRTRCAPTTTRCRRRPSGCATRSSARSPTRPTPRRCGWSPPPPPPGRAGNRAAREGDARARRDRRAAEGPRARVRRLRTDRRRAAARGAAASALRRNGRRATQEPRRLRTAEPVLHSSTPVRDRIRARPETRRRRRRPGSPPLGAAAPRRPLRHRSRPCRRSPRRLCFVALADIGDLGLLGGDPLAASRTAAD